MQDTDCGTSTCTVSLLISRTPTVCTSRSWRKWPNCRTAALLQYRVRGRSWKSSPPPSTSRNLWFQASGSCDTQQSHTDSSLRGNMFTKNEKINVWKTVDWWRTTGCLLSVKGYFHVSVSRCKEKHPDSKLSAEELEAIAEIEKSTKDRTNSFLEMESFLPKKNGLGSESHLLLRLRLWDLIQLFPACLCSLYLTLVLGNVNVTLLNKQAKWVPFPQQIPSAPLLGVPLTPCLRAGSPTKTSMRSSNWWWRSSSSSSPSPVASSSATGSHPTVLPPRGASNSTPLLRLCSSRTLDALFNFLLVWYYCTLTIRESILITNGSRSVASQAFPEGSLIWNSGKLTLFSPVSLQDQRLVGLPPLRVHLPVWRHAHLVSFPLFLPNVWTCGKVEVGCVWSPPGLKASSTSSSGTSSYPTVSTKVRASAAVEAAGL